MGTVINVILDILAILAIIVFGSFIVVVVADLILCCFDDHEGIIFRRKKKTESKTETVEEDTVKKDDIVVYSNQTNPNGTISKEQKVDTVDGEVVTEIDFDKAVEEHRGFKDYKTVLQEVIQKNPGEVIEYVLVKESGPDHNKRFEVEVHLNSNVIGKGGGTSKKKAEQLAAKEALELMGL